MRARDLLPSVGTLPRKTTGLAPSEVGIEKQVGRPENDVASPVSADTVSTDMRVEGATSCGAAGVGRAPHPMEQQGLRVGLSEGVLSERQGVRSDGAPRGEGLIWERGFFGRTRAFRGWSRGAFEASIAHRINTAETRFGSRFGS